MRTETWVVVFSITALVNVVLSTLILFCLSLDRHILLLAYITQWTMMAVLLAELDRLCNYWESQALGVRTTLSSKGVTK